MKPLVKDRDLEAAAQSAPVDVRTVRHQAEALDAFAWLRVCATVRVAGMGYEMHIASPDVITYETFDMDPFEREMLMISNALLKERLDMEGKW
jgi:hypothetical protein